jgi:hypothetical protein
MGASAGGALAPTAAWRFAFLRCGKFVRHANEITKRIAVNARQTYENPFVTDVVIGNVVRGGIGGQQLLALFEIRARYE